MNRFSKVQVATVIAIIFHLVGVIGILVFNSKLIIDSTPLNLLLSFVLLVWTQVDKSFAFWLFLVTAFSIGFLAEVIGVNTGLLFGQYAYGTVLGPKWMNVPFTIGLNWFVIIFSCGITVHTLLMKLSTTVSNEVVPTSATIRSLAVIVDAATLAVLFDWLMEPIAIRLGFWQWGGSGNIPIYNYVCWFLISLLLLAVFMAGKFSKRNKFAIHLLLIQVMFFLLLHTFLK